MKGIYIAIALLLFMVGTVMAASSSNNLLDDLDGELSSDEKEQLAEALSPIGKLIAAAQYVASAIMVLAIIAAGFIHLKGDQDSKGRAMSIIGRVFVASLLIFGATFIVGAFGLG